MALVQLTNSSKYRYFIRILSCILPSIPCLTTLNKIKKMKQKLWWPAEKLEKEKKNNENARARRRRKKLLEKSGLET